MTEFKLLRAPLRLVDLDDFERIIQTHLNDGWKMRGDLVVLPQTTDGYGSMIVQAMVRNKPGIKLPKLKELARAK